MKLDVIMPVYNTRPDHLLEAVFSILRQTYHAFNLVIINDGSTQANTLELLKILPGFDNRIRIINTQHKGISNALNVGLQNSDAHFIARMDGDDISHPERFEKQVTFLIENPDTDVLGTGIDLFWDDDIFRKRFIQLRKCDYPTELGDEGFLVAHGTTFYNREKAIQLGGYDHKILRKQDIDFFFRMHENGLNIRNIPDVLYLWRRYR